jgi:putative DNA primase/helicase
MGHADGSVKDARPARPAEPVWQSIPSELIALSRWLLWRYDLRAAKWTKVPLQPDGSAASSTDASTWSPFDFVQSAYITSGNFDGVGFVLNGSGLVAWDFDHVVEPDGTISDAKIVGYVGTLDSYTELSPSGSGLRVLTFGRLPENDRKLRAIECYDDQRYVTITGRHLPITPTTINRRQDAIDAVHAAVFAERTAKREADAAYARAHAAKPVDLDDAALLERARRAKNGARFIALYDDGDWEGEGFPSQSEADLALCSMLGFWCGGNTAHVNSLFRRSALMREKWLRNDYRERTLATAVAWCTDPHSNARTNSTADEARAASDANHRSGDAKDGPEDAENTSEQAGPQPPTQALTSEDGLALNFVEEHADRLLYVKAWGLWLRYERGVWKSDQTLAVFDLGRSLCRKVAAAVKNQKLAAELRKAKTVAAVEHLARSDRRVAATIDQFDTDLWALNTPGGLLDLRTGRLRQHRRQDFTTKVTAATPADSADCPQWLTFLARIMGGDDTLIQFLQRSAGYSLTGITTEQVLFFLYGNGANGKSVFVNTLLGLLNDYATTAPSEIFMDSAVDRHPTEMADLRGARVVAAT